MSQISYFVLSLVSFTNNAIKIVLIGFNMIPSCAKATEEPEAEEHA